MQTRGKSGRASRRIARAVRNAARVIERVFAPDCAAKPGSRARRSRGQGLAKRQLFSMTKKAKHLRAAQANAQIGFRWRVSAKNPPGNTPPGGKNSGFETSGLARSQARAKTRGNPVFTGVLRDTCKWIYPLAEDLQR
jgi:hypothetical protein